MVVALQNPEKEEEVLSNQLFVDHVSSRDPFTPTPIPLL